MARIGQDFPAPHQQVNGHLLIYLDTAASCHKPHILGERLYQLYLAQYAKPHENHPMSVAMTEQLESTRQLVADEFMAAKDEIIFVRGCTASCHLLRARGAEGRRWGDCCWVSYLFIIRFSQTTPVVEPQSHLGRPG